MQLSTGVTVALLLSSNAIAGAQRLMTLRLCRPLAERNVDLEGEPVGYPGRVPTTGGHAAGHFIKWHTIKSQESSVVQDVRRIREHPLVPADVPIYGYIYDVRTGHLNEVKSATEAGKSSAARRAK
jgi:hypothetical protein